MRLASVSGAPLLLVFLPLMQFPGSVFAQPRGNVEVAIGHIPADPSPDLTVYTSETNYLQFWIWNVNSLNAMLLGFEIVWPPTIGVSFDLEYAGPGRAVKEYGDAVGAFDMTGGLIEMFDIDGVSPDAFLFGGAAFVAGLPPHAVPALLYEMEFEVTGILPSTGFPLFWVDNIFYPPAGPWSMHDYLGDFPPDFWGFPNTSPSIPDAPPFGYLVDFRLRCGDVDCNSIVNISDAVYMISYIFGGGPEPCAGCR